MLRPSQCYVRSPLTKNCRSFSWCIPIDGLMGLHEGAEIQMSFKLIYGTGRHLQTIYIASQISEGNPWWFISTVLSSIVESKRINASISVT